MKLRHLLLASAMLAVTTAAAQAAEPEQCKTVRMADVGWSDNTAQNGLFKTVLKGLGYTPEDQVLALPVIIESLKNNDLDIFLDNWMPSNAANVQPYLDEKSIEMLNANLSGAGYGPVVPKYVADAGVKDVKDLAANADKFEKKFYGIEPGNDGNKIVQAKIDDPANGLGDAQIKTLTRPGYSAECANVGKLLANLKFTLPMESTIMDAIGGGADGEKAAADWLKANPGVLDSWLAGVTTVDGKDGLAAVKSSLGV